MFMVCYRTLFSSSYLLHRFAAVGSWMLLWHVLNITADQVQPLPSRIICPATPQIPVRNGSMNMTKCPGKGFDLASYPDPSPTQTEPWLEHRPHTSRPKRIHCECCCARHNKTPSEIPCLHPDWSKLVCWHYRDLYNRKEVLMFLHFF